MWWTALRQKNRMSTLWWVCRRGLKKHCHGSRHHRQRNNPHIGVSGAVTGVSSQSVQKRQLLALRGLAGFRVSATDGILPVKSMACAWSETFQCSSVMLRFSLLPSFLSGACHCCVLPGASNEGAIFIRVVRRGSS